MEVNFKALNSSTKKNKFNFKETQFKFKTVKIIKKVLLSFI